MSPPYTERRLADIESRMAECVKSGDKEAAHKNGDALLLEVIGALTEFHQSEDERNIIERVVRSWHRITKWYS